MEEVPRGGETVLLPELLEIEGLNSPLTAFTLVKLNQTVGTVETEIVDEIVQDPLQGFPHHGPPSMIAVVATNARRNSLQGRHLSEIMVNIHFYLIHVAIPPLLLQTIYFYNVFIPSAQEYSLQVNASKYHCESETY